MVIDILNKEVILATIVWLSENRRSKQGAANLGGFHIEAIIADEPEYLSVAIDAVVAEHLLDGDRSRASALVGNVLHKIRIACHNMKVYFLRTSNHLPFSHSRTGIS